VPEPLLYIPTPPSLSVKVGVPPDVLTVTFSLKSTVNVTILPVVTRPLPPASIPLPDAMTEVSVGGLVSMVRLGDV
jgi:hypothetical protein